MARLCRLFALHSSPCTVHTSPQADLRDHPYARLSCAPRAVMRVVVLLLALICLAGCGLKGPLYLPTPQQEREMAEREKHLE